MTATVISAFPGTGKSYFTEHSEGLRVLDSDSSGFSWASQGVRHPDFPRNYIEHIQANLDLADYIMVSSHKVVRDALKDAGIPFISVYPLACLKTEYVQRFTHRGSPQAFINLLEANWTEWTAAMGEGNDHYVLLGAKETITDVVKVLERRKELVHA